MASVLSGYIRLTRGGNNNRLIRTFRVKGKYYRSLVATAVAMCRPITDALNAQNSAALHRLECCFCLTNEKNVVFLNCGHMCICATCLHANKFIKCPRCRAPNTGTLRVYY